MHEAAEILADDVPESARFAWVDGDAGDLGVPEPQRWLAWRADRSSLTPFGPEYAPGAGTVSVASLGPPADAVDKWVDDVRLLGATHIVTGNGEKAALLDGHERLAPLLGTERLAVWRIESRPDSPTGGLTITGVSRIVDHGVNRYDVEVIRDADGPVEFALGWSPGWELRVDGEPVDTYRSPFGRLEAELTEGRHDVELRFVESTAGPIGRVVTVLALLAAIVWWIRQRRRSTRSDPVADTGSKSPATARR